MSKGKLSEHIPLITYALVVIGVFAAERTRNGLLSISPCLDTCYSTNRVADYILSLPEVFLPNALGIAFSFLWIAILVAALAALLARFFPENERTYSILVGGAILLVPIIAGLLGIL